MTQKLTNIMSFMNDPLAKFKEIISYRMVCIQVRIPMKSTILLLFQTIVLSTWLTPVIFLTPRCDPKKESQYKWPTEFFFDPESDTKILARFKYLIQRFESDPKNFFWVHRIHGQNVIIWCLFESDMVSCRKIEKFLQSLDHFKSDSNWT